MTTQAKGKIFLSDERGCTQTEWFRSYNTFNFGKYRHEHKQAFGNLYVLNDDTLAGGHSIKLTVEESTLILLLPIIGAIVYEDNNGNTGIVNSGEMQMLYMDANSTVNLSNPYENGLVNFLQLWIKHPFTPGNTNRLLHFDLKDRNKLISVTGKTKAQQHPAVAIGKFIGRHEAAYKTSNQNSVFVFVIQGVFEVQGRLLHARDGLALWNEPNEIELEALSNDAIVMVTGLAY